MARKRTVFDNLISAVIERAYSWDTKRPIPGSDELLRELEDAADRAPETDEVLRQLALDVAFETAQLLARVPAGDFQMATQVLEVYQGWQESGDLEPVKPDEMRAFRLAIRVLNALAGVAADDEDAGDPSALPREALTAAVEVLRTLADDGEDYQTLLGLKEHLDLDDEACAEYADHLAALTDAPRIQSQEDEDDEDE